MIKNPFHVSDCRFEDVSGFIRKVCIRNGESLFQCPGSQELYEIKDQKSEYQVLSGLCPKDKYQYAACYLPFSTPLMFNNTVVAVCGYFVCLIDYFDRFWSGQLVNHVTWCNNRRECDNGGVDEKYCTEEEEVMFQCRGYDGSVRSEVSTSRVCDKKCNCLFCDDEWQCNGYRYHYWYKCNTTTSTSSAYICDNDPDCRHGGDESNCRNVAKCVREDNSQRTYMLSNYSRCTPWVVCANKLDQTNCSDTTLAPLQCYINGYMSNVSQHIICKRIVFIIFNYHHRNTSAVCDDGMDMQCVTPTPGCYIHKHQLCNNITDCKGGSDEKSALCFRVAAKECKRKFHHNTSLKLPIGWIGDGIEDCVDGLDENTFKWKSCKYGTFTIFGSDQCNDVYICPSGYPLYVEIASLCDEMLSCQGGNRICSIATSTLDQQKYTPIKAGDVTYLQYCLLGYQDLNTYLEQCEHVIYPPVEILGTQPNNLYLPTKHVSCGYMYGEQYVYLSCSGKCNDAKCPITYPISGITCSNIFKRKTYSISSDGKLVIIQKDKKDFKVKNVFVCLNHNCIPYSKVCNLIDDCGDGTDEDSCHNHFACNIKTNNSKSYIPLSSVCDGTYDCLDSSDESTCCHRMLINSFILKMSSWLIGILSLLLNGSVQIRNICSIKDVRTSTALIVKVLIILISFGDGLVGVYLMSLAVVDLYFGSSFCSTQLEWLLSSHCSILGVVSTVGSQISLFSMTILSVARFVTVYRRRSTPAPVNKKSYVLVGSISLFVVGLSVAVAVIPLMPRFEDTFVNALHFPDINFLRGFATKMSLKPILVSYYGRIRLDVSKLSWEILTSMINGMFTSNYGGISKRTLGFYGNDPVCLFKFFVSSDEPQTIYSWSVLAANFVCFGVISISYVAVFLTTSASSKGLANIARKRNDQLQRKISFIILTDFMCWTPFIVFCFLHTMGIIDASPWYALLSILILPINSIINPLLYDSVIVNGLTMLLHRLRRTPNTNSRAQTAGYTTSPILPDVAREPGHTTPPILPDVAREQGHTTLPILPDVSREPGHITPPILPDIARESEHTTPPILPDIAREQGYTTPPIVLDIVTVREPEHTTPPILPDVAREQGHTTPPIVLDIVTVREPEHTTPPLLPVISENSTVVCKKKIEH